MIEKHGDLFSSNAPYLAHGVNTMGLMGAGIALPMKQKYPKNYAGYTTRCDDGRLKPGGFYGCADSGKIIVNLASQDLPGANARYEWVFSSMLGVSQALQHQRNERKQPPRIAMPLIGCGIGGLEWAGVKKIIETVETIAPLVEYEVWHYAP